MSEEKKLLSVEAADKLLACADGTAALLYLQILRSGGFSLTNAAKVLKRSEAEVALAANTLRLLGLLELQTPQWAPEPPQYHSQDITDAVRTDSAFSGVVNEAERVLGRVLSTNDLQLLLSIYNYYGLPADVIMLLLHHCIETHQERHGAGRMPTMRSVVSEAHYWAENEILDLDAAEEHIRREKARRERGSQIRDVLQIRDRALTATERKYVEAWLDMGFDAETLAIAYDRTVTSTGKLTWKYMDRIVRSWDEKKLYTPEAIAAGDTRPGRPPRQERSKERSEDDKMDDMRRMLQSMKKRGEG